MEQIVCSPCSLEVYVQGQSAACRQGTGDERDAWGSAMSYKNCCTMGTEENVIFFPPGI